jgi:glutamate racemase
MTVGVFDSGLGGLTVVSEIIDRHPALSLVYIADTRYAPYGEKSLETVRLRAREITRHLIEKHRIDALVVACNTATAAAISDLREDFPNLIIVGTEPGVKPAVETTRSGHVGVLATPATLRSEKFLNLKERFEKEAAAHIYAQACPGLAERIEAGEAQSETTKDLLRRWLEPMKDAGVDTVVLGCTHYPLVSDTIARIMGKKTHIIHTGEAIARRLASLLGEDVDKGKGGLELYATGEIRSDIASRLLGRDITVVPIEL